MKKLFLVSLLLFPIYVWSSNWIYIGQNSSQTSFFVDIQSISSNGNERTFWYRHNLAARSKWGDLSSKINITINCRVRDFKLNYFITYSDVNNQGDLLESFKGTQGYEPIPPDSMYESMMRVVCK